MSKPIIGISLHRDVVSGRTIQGVGEFYIRAILRSGGVPVLLPVNTQQDDLDLLFSKLNGLVMTGGPDFSPMFYGSSMHPNVKGIDVQRDESDVRLVRNAIERKLPLLGICRGIQAINLAFGGTLYTEVNQQHPDAIHHTCYPDLPKDFLSHQVEIVNGSQMEGIFKKHRFEVNSLHHQGIKDLGTGLAAEALAPDGLVEGVSLPDHTFGIGVQWHPELLEDNVESRLLFDAFVEAADTVG